MIVGKKAGIAAALVVAAAVTVWSLWRPEQPAVQPATAAKPATEARQASTSNAQASLPKLPPPVAVTKQADAAISLSAKVKELSASPEPRDAYTAFHILRQCKHARDEERQYQLTRRAEQDPERVLLINAGVVGEKFIKQSCGDLKDADFRDKIALVERAAEAGVPMAALYYSAEGPWGDTEALYSRWDDPLVQEWRAKAIRLWHLAAQKGDVTALNAIQSNYETGEGLIAERNSELALRYAVAKHIVHEAEAGRKIWGAKWELEQMTAAVTPEAAAREKAAGEAMAKEILSGRKQ
jgi:hypothetical protein